MKLPLPAKLRSFEHLKKITDQKRSQLSRHFLNKRKMKRLIILRYVKIGLQGFLNFLRKKPIAEAKHSKSGIKIVLSETDFTKILAYKTLRNFELTVIFLKIGIVLQLILVLIKLHNKGLL